MVKARSSCLVLVVCCSPCRCASNIVTLVSSHTHKRWVDCIIQSSVLIAPTCVSRGRRMSLTSDGTRPSGNKDGSIPQRGKTHLVSCTPHHCSCAVVTHMQKCQAEMIKGHPRRMWSPHNKLAESQRQCQCSYTTACHDLHLSALT